LTGAKFDGANLQDANFEHAHVSDVSVTGARFCNTRWINNVINKDCNNEWSVPDTFRHCN
jgi:uncharacterized protein YjbI with pentapeptide repeats